MPNIEDARRLIESGQPEYELLRREAKHRHPSITSVAQYFSYKHLPDDLKLISVQFCSTARYLVTRIGRDDPQLTIALQKLLESKDAAVRAALNARETDAEENV